MQRAFNIQPCAGGLGVPWAEKDRDQMGSGHKAEQAASKASRWWTEAQTIAQRRGGGEKQRGGGTDLY